MTKSRYKRSIETTCGLGYLFFPPIPTKCHPSLRREPVQLHHLLFASLHELLLARARGLGEWTEFILLALAVGSGVEDLV